MASPKKGGGGEGGGVIGDAPLLTEVNEHVDLLTPVEQAKVATITAAYNEDEDSVTEAQVLFILDCGKQIVRKLFAG